MSQEGIDKALLIVGGQQREFVMARSPAQEYALLEELRFVRREAQAEADLAYEEWRCKRSLEAYAVYRAAQDRADAAQDDLAQWVQKLAA
jgi:hypothetical protein